ncbi:nucleoside hydrolase 3 [Cryptomeria japonica]|uniref:nucleoside hydrolase 3 n=1 Tax=Cryptomeria japonica TaxID=3369 RepID=UPI0025AB6992|nr:nucleoside hydrolase 3 [Cryptomeria japonica]XP_057849895.1 nucleoside hydrolase 3 [Cryptomeria japonica]XP_057849896.1 nucleoside hydrolase 3 [Cryptomeria japonica]XP_057849897.1 nucleoside hydrolase 3 [Cryptomeria japonica]XP_057849898.1 nucleoside hydrolase 3 [Cryptomeria japonica]
MKPSTIAFFQTFLLACLYFIYPLNGVPHQILLDSDIDTDDFFAILYLLKQNRSEFNLKAITINANTWTDVGHSVNQLYDILYMMGRDDIPVGIGGEGGILPNGEILPNVGGYLPLIEQELSTVGGCRYRQSIPPGSGGRLDTDSNYGIRKDFLPQGERHYSPLKQPTAQEVMFEALSSGPTTVVLIGAHTNFAIFLKTYPHLLKNVDHVYVMGGGVRSKNPTGCCPEDGNSSCTPGQCGDRGNLFTGYHSNPFAEFNIFGDPFAAYQVIHSGLPITLVPLDATNTILINEEFFTAFEQSQHTYEAKYCFESLKFVRDTWFDDEFYTSYFMWDSFTSGVVVSSILNGHTNTEDNEFAELEYANITVVTSNKPYGVQDGSNPFFDDRTLPKFHLNKGVHSGHVQTSLVDPFCFVPNGKGKCQDGYTKEVSGMEGVRILLATKAKPNRNSHSLLNREYYMSFLDALNSPHQTAKFNLKTEFPYYKEVLYKPDLEGKLLGKPIIFDMDMSPGDFITLFYLLKLPVELIDIKGITVNGNGWGNAATIDIIYDVLHMMGRDDIPVGLGDFFALGQTYSYFSSVGDCKYSRAIPYGSGGSVDCDTLFGLARDLPRSPRRYTAHNSVKYGAPRNTDHPELRQPKAEEIWQNVSQELKPGSKVTILTTGPLTNIANLLSSDTNSSSKIEHIYIVGGNIDKCNKSSNGNVFTMPSNKNAEFNVFLDPKAAKQVIATKLNITLIPLSVQRKASFLRILQELKTSKETPEAKFVRHLLSDMDHLHQTSHVYKHLDMFLGDVVGAATMIGPELIIKTKQMPVKVVETGDVATDGWTVLDHDKGNSIHVVEDIDLDAYFRHFATMLNDKAQSAVIASYSEQKRLWSTHP